jgi:plastocyanin
MSQQPVTEEPLVGEVRFKVPLPLAIPLVALAAIAIAAITFSRVLLSLPKEGAVVVAMVLAANVLGACTFIALKPKMTGATMLELAAVVIYPVLIGVVIASTGIGGGAHGSEHGPEEAPGGGAGTGVAAGAVVAEGLAFGTDTIELQAGGQASIPFNNEDTAEHNVAIYANQEDGVAFADPLFQGEVIQGGQSITYEFKAPKKGTYYFQCDIHPNMNGQVTVK